MKLKMKREEILKKYTSNSMTKSSRWYMNTLGNKKAELFDMGGGVGEPTAEENVRMASEMSNQELIDAGTKTMLGQRQWMKLIRLLRDLSRLYIKQLKWGPKLLLP